MLGFSLIIVVATALGRPLAMAADEPDERKRNVAWQIALERVGFSPGIIDGRIGRKTMLATREFQRVRGLEATGLLDEASMKALNVAPSECLTTYRIQAADLEQVGDLPKSWLAKSRAKRLPYPSLDEVLAERFHCSRDLLAELNPGRSIAGLAAGDEVNVPHVADAQRNSPAGSLVISLSEKVIRVVDQQSRLTALFHCSIAADKAKLPSGETRITVIADNPTYRFDPRMWPEVKGIDHELFIPPGPRNPVGVCWIGLDWPGYGIHGTPSPELIGKTGSHGCIRLTNWDVVRLSRMIQPGARVRFEE